MGDGSVRRDFVHARDAARAAVEVLAIDDPPEILNVGVGSSVSMLELIDLLGEVAGRSLEVQARPERAIDVPITELDSSRLSDLTGWKPEVELREGVAECFELATRAQGSPT